MEVRTREDGSVEWHRTKYTAANMQREGFRICATVTITCTYHPPTVEMPHHEAWYELMHVFVLRSACPELLQVAHEALLAAADRRFECANDSSADPRKLKLRKLSSAKGVKGEIVDVAKKGGRANKTQHGCMCMYGAHSRRAATPSEKVPGSSQEGPRHGQTTTMRWARL